MGARYHLGVSGAEKQMGTLLRFSRVKQDLSPTRLKFVVLSSVFSFARFAGLAR
jgi:hypothetical protein